jgi:hypothetical protein
MWVWTLAPELDSSFYRRKWKDGESDLLLSFMRQEWNSFAGPEDSSGKNSREPRSLRRRPKRSRQNMGTREFRACTDGRLFGSVSRSAATRPRLNQ